MGTGTRNKNAGSNWEREIVTLLNSEKIFHKVGTSRLLSKSFDDNKIDVITEVISKMEEFGLAIQAKTSTTTLRYPQLLNEVKEGMSKLGISCTPVIFHKQTQRVKERFMPRGTFASLYLGDFIKIFKKLEVYKQAYELLNSYFDSIPDDEKDSVNAKLLKLEL